MILLQRIRGGGIVNLADNDPTFCACALIVYALGYDFLLKSIGRYIILPLFQEFVWNTDNCHVANLVLKMDQNTVLLNVYFVQYTHYYYQYYQTLLFLRQIMNKQLEHINLSLGAHRFGRVEFRK